MSIQYAGRAALVARAGWLVLCATLFGAQGAVAAKSANPPAGCNPAAANCAMSAEEADRYLEYVIAQCQSDPRLCREAGPELAETAHRPAREDCADPASCTAAKDRAKALRDEYQSFCTQHARACDRRLQKVLEVREARARERELQCKAPGRCGGEGE